MEKIQYPYLPLGREILYVPLSNKYMFNARSWAKQHSDNKKMPTGAVIAKGTTIIGMGTNSSSWEENHSCKEEGRSNPEKDYELCGGCHPRGHSELSAINEALRNKYSTLGADLYLWGHWWCCRSCCPKCTTT